MPFKDFQPEVLSSADVNTYLMKQSVMVFDSATARTTALTAPVEGMITYLKDTNSAWVYDGSSWIELGRSARSGLVQVIPTSVSGTGATLLSSGTVFVANGSTSFTIVNCFNATYDVYEVVISDMTLSTDAGILFQLRTLNTTSATAYYYSNGYGANFYNGTGAPTVVSLANQANWDLGILAGSAGGGGAKVTIANPYLSKKTTISGVGTDPRTTGNGRLSFSGFHDLATAYVSLVISSPANFNRCRVSIYGYNQ